MSGFSDRLLCAFLLVFVVLGASTPSVQAQDFRERILSPPAMPTEVYIDVYAVEVASIDEREETFEITARIFALWKDPRLAFDLNTPEANANLYQGATAEEALKSEIWWPYFEIVDERDPREILYLSVTVKPDGSVEYNERFRTRIKQPYDLSEFPYDSHRVSFSLEPFALPGDSVRFLEQDQDNLVEWGTDEWMVRESFLEIHPGTADRFARATVVIGIERVAGFYISNFVLPLILIVVISSAVFWMNLDHMRLSARLGVSFTSMLTIVAFDFVASESLPNLSYATRLDSVLTLGYVFLTINIIENVAACRMYELGRTQAARSIDAIFRWAYPAAFLAVVIIALVWGRESLFDETDQYQQQIDSQLQAAAEHFLDAGYELTHVISDEQLNDGHTFEFPIDLEGSVEYQIVGVCDNDCSDLDLEILDSENTSVDSDYEIDDIPIVSLTPIQSTQFTIRVSMADCNVEPCKWGVGVFGQQTGGRD